MRRFPQKCRSRAVMLQEEGEFGLPLVRKSGGTEERDSIKQRHLVKAEYERRELCRVVRRVTVKRCRYASHGHGSN